MKSIYFYFIIFGAGVVCALLATYLTVKFTPNQRRNYLSEDHYLQVRDDYSVYTTKKNNLFDEQQSDRMRRAEKKNKEEGWSIRL